MKSLHNFKKKGETKKEKNLNYGQELETIDPCCKSLLVFEFDPMGNQQQYLS
jgi:hypothetical protein